MRHLNRRGLEPAEVAAGRVVGSVFVLATPDGNVELSETEDDELVVWAYRGIEDLVASCGEGQPWMRVTADELARLSAAEPPVLVALDVWHPDGVRYPAPGPRETPRLDRVEPPSTGVWIPTRRAPDRGQGTDGPDAEFDVELYAVTPGRPLLPVFTSAAALRAGCGPYQAAVAVRPDALEELVGGTGAHGVVVDPILTEQARHQAPVVDWKRREPRRG